MTVAIQECGSTPDMEETFIKLEARWGRLVDNVAAKSNELIEKHIPVTYRVYLVGIGIKKLGKSL